MDDVPLCPPWWPNFLWWLLHHHNRIPRPDEKTVDFTEDILTSLVSYHSAALLPEQLATSAREAAGQRLMDAAQQLVGQGR